MTLPEEVVRKVLEWLGDHLRGCPVCGGRNFATDVSDVVLFPLDMGSMVLVPISCLGCGNTLLFNPLVMGLEKEFTRMVRLRGEIDAMMGERDTL